MSDDPDDLEKRPKDEDGATGDSASPSESPRDKKPKLSTTERDTPVPASRRLPLSAQDLLVAGRYTFWVVAVVVVGNPT